MKKQTAHDPSVFHVCFPHMRIIYKLRSPSKDGEFPGSERMVCHYFPDRICANELRVKNSENAMCYYSKCYLWISISLVF